MNLEKYIQLAFFSGLCTAEIQLLSPFFAPQTWVAGTVVFEQGDYADYLYLVVTGEMTIRYKPDDGPMMNITHVVPGAFLGGRQRWATRLIPPEQSAHWIPRC